MELRFTLSADGHSGRASNGQSAMAQAEIGCVLTPPRYLVCLDSLKNESHSSHTRYFGSSGKNIFSRSLAVSSLLVKHLPSDEPCLHGNDGCVESYGGSAHPLYLQSRDGTWVCSLYPVHLSIYHCYHCVASPFLLYYSYVSP